ncbi:MAG: hypothetical protein Ta2G_03660 [Termitinemataceae bacterium]|nr:MAG: hypothetical protein Ta2G_03660 [Termitinemataceae bacterium]
MVKKKMLFVVLCVTMLSAFVYAQDEDNKDSKNNYFQLGGTFLSVNSAGIPIYGGGINFAAVSYFQGIVGFGSYIDLMYAKYLSANLLVLDLLVGPAFKIAIGKRFRLPIALGVYLEDIFAFGGGAAVSGFNIGLGANVTAEYWTSEKFHIYARMQVDYAFLGGGDFFTNPSIGIGFTP